MHPRCTISLAENPGTLARFTFHGAPGRNCTDTWRGLSPLPLHWATGAKLVPAAEVEAGHRKDGGWARDSHPHCLRSKRSASAVGHAGN